MGDERGSRGDGRTRTGGHEERKELSGQQGLKERGRKLQLVLAEEEISLHLSSFFKVNNY
jgi:hypothetical protein